MHTHATFAMMRLASQALPIGGFSYSQGLESAIERAWVRDEASLVQWIADGLKLNVGSFEAPVLWACCNAVDREQMTEAMQLNDWYLASRETAELHAETLQMGYSMLRLLAGLSDDAPDARASVSLSRQLLDDNSSCTLPLAWALAGQAFGLTATQSLQAWLWAWVENQIAAAIKAVPLGQQAGQRVIERLEPDFDAVVSRAVAMPADSWSNFAPGLAMVSSWHESQYSRLFRS